MHPVRTTTTIRWNHRIVVYTIFIASATSFQHIHQHVFHYSTTLQNPWFYGVNSFCKEDDKRYDAGCRYHSRAIIIHYHDIQTKRQTHNQDDDHDHLTQKDVSKFSMEQRVESLKSALVGLVSGGIALAPMAAIREGIMLALKSLGSSSSSSHVLNGIAQWEFDTDMGSIMACLFAIVYRYCIREDDKNNPQLNLGVWGAFVLTRTLSRIQVPSYCTAIPLNCTLPGCREILFPF
jgi:hypothetical protein